MQAKIVAGMLLGKADDLPANDPIVLCWSKSTKEIFGPEWLVCVQASLASLEIYGEYEANDDGACSSDCVLCCVV